MSWGICTTIIFNRGALKQRRLGKDGFNKQVSKAFCAGCLGEFAQQGHSTREPFTTKGWARMASATNSPRHFLQDVLGNLHNNHIQQGALKHRRLGKVGFSIQLSKALFARCLGEFAQHSCSTGEPLSTEGWARMASTNKSPRHFVQDALGNLHNKDIEQGCP